MSTLCNKFGSTEDANKARASGSKYQGDIGEHVANDVMTNDLGFAPEFFDQPYKGFDGVFRDENGTLVIMESKMTEKNGLSSLKETAHGRQGDIEKIEYEAYLMQHEPGKATPDNIRIGEEISRVGADQVRFVLVYTNPSTLESTAFEKVGDSWEVVSHRDPMGDGK